jgi:hypothetical protein
MEARERKSLEGSVMLKGLGAHPGRAGGFDEG